MFLCVAAGHSKVRLERASTSLTIYKRKWAVCPAGLSDGHTWQETTGLNYDDLFEKHVAEKHTR